MKKLDEILAGKKSVGLEAFSYQALLNKSLVTDSYPR